MGGPRLGLVLAVTAVVALGALGPASGRSGPPAKYGGQLVVNLAVGEPSTLDPIVTGAGIPLVIYHAMCQQLYDHDATQQLVPVLAASVPVPSPDKLSYTIQLRRAVLFNDGTPFNAQAVLATVRRYITAPGSGRAIDYADVASVTASGPYTVVFHLKARDSTFIGGNNSYILSPSALASEGDNFGAHPVCVGPFMFDHRVAGDNVTLIKSPYYYDKGDVYLDKLVFKFITDTSAAAAALQAGDIQALDSVSPTALPAVQQDSSLQVIQSPELGWSGVIFNIGNRSGVGSPYSNLGTPFASSAKLRQAFEEAIDRNALNKVVYGGLEQVSCTMVAPEDAAWFNATKVPCTPYNPADAKKLVAASGFPNPTVHLLVNSASDTVRKAQFIQAQEAAVGIKVVIETADVATIGAREKSGNFELRFGNFMPGGADPDYNIDGSVATAGPRNYMGYSNPRLDLILSNGLKATGIAARSTLYHVAQQIIANDRPLIVLYNPTAIAAYSASLTGLHLSASGLLIVEGARYK